MPSFIRSPVITLPSFHITRCDMSCGLKLHFDRVPNAPLYSSSSAASYASELSRSRLKTSASISESPPLVFFLLLIISETARSLAFFDDSPAAPWYSFISETKLVSEGSSGLYWITLSAVVPCERTILRPGAENIECGMSSKRTRSDSASLKIPAWSAEDDGLPAAPEKSRGSGFFDDWSRSRPKMTASAVDSSPVYFAVGGRCQKHDGPSGGSVREPAAPWKSRVSAEPESSVSRP